MAEIKDFEQSNFTWKGWPANLEQDVEEVLDLPVHKYADAEPGEDGPEISISCWKLTEDELKEIAETGVVWLHVWGRQPPVLVGGQNPFTQTEEADNDSEES